jgi:rhodanese-related sulfurtransferase
VKLPSWLRKSTHDIVTGRWQIRKHQFLQLWYKKGSEMGEIELVTANPVSASQGRRSWLMMMYGVTALGVFSLMASGRKEYNVPQIDLVAAKELIEHGATVIDVRGTESFNEAHIPMAVLVPLEVLKESIPLWLTALKAIPIVVYCGDGSTHGPAATQLLVDAGFAHPVNLTAGMNGWKAAGYKVQTA